ncbi:MAG: Jag N-terminal domain-containing protein [Actinomycetota bacterium]|nr:Jag N-terminal domain-containing protein [Actinomycetota bacterium]
MREIERSAASVEEAVEAALQELGVSEQEVDVEVLREPSRGLLGLKTVDAVVRVRLREGPSESVDLEAQAEVGADFLQGLLDEMDIEADVDPNLVDGVMYLDVLGREDDEDMGLLIGRHGQTLEALQELVRGAVQRQTAERCRVLVDVEDYRKRRRAQLAARAREVAKRVARTGKEEILDPMRAYERKIVHDAAAEISGVETASEGEEPDRSVVIRKRD